MYDTYFLGCSIKEGFDAEFISIFDGWVGQDNLDQLDTVTDLEWSRV